MILGVILALAFVGAGAFLLMNADAIVRRSQQPGSRWVIPQHRRLVAIRAAAGFYLLVGLLLAYGVVATRR